MGILDTLLPPLAAARLRGDIAELNRIALLFAAPDANRLTPSRAALWTASCNAAANLVTELFVKNSDKALNWGLRRHRRRLNHQRLAAIYWWMLLYQLVLFRNRGIDGYDKAADFDALYNAAEDLMAQFIALPHIRAAHPGVWAERWQAQVGLEAAIGMYNRTMDIMGIAINAEARITCVSLFTSATERAYDRVTKPAVLRAAQDIGRSRPA